MQLVYAPRVKETSATTGTGTYTLAGAVAGFQAFSAIGNTRQCVYVAENGTDWEVGIGTYTSSGTTLSRDAILASSNVGAAVSWAAGSRNIFCDIPASLVNAFAHELNPSVGGFTYPADLPSILNGGLICAGAQSVANGSWAVAIGGYARAVGSNALALGSSPYANADYTVSIGNNATAGGASGLGAIAIGGTSDSAKQSHATGICATNVGANGGNASGDYSAVYGGLSNAAAGLCSTAIGGEQNSAATSHSIALGWKGKTHVYGALALGGGDTQGFAQVERTIQRKSTTTATTTALEFDADAATNGYLTLPANFGAAVIVHVTARETATGDCAMFRLEGGIHTDGSGVPSLVGTPPSAVDLGHSTGAAAWTAALAVDGTTHNCLLVNVTGEAAKTIKWVARIELVEVGA